MKKYFVFLSFSLLILILFLGKNCIGQIQDTGIIEGKDTVQIEQTTMKEFKTKTMSDLKTVDKETWAIVKKGDRYINYGQKDYDKAMEFYLKAYKITSDNARLNHKIGKCYLEQNKAKSIVFIEKAYLLNNRIDKKIHFQLGRAYHLNSDLETAIKKFELYIEKFKKLNRSLSPEEIDSCLQEVYKEIEECNTGIELKQNPIKVFIDNLGDSINSPFAEYGPFITADESTMFFTSRRENSSGGKKSDIDYEYYEDIYISYYHDGNWSRPENIGKPVNSRTNDAVVGISLDGQKLFIYRDARGGDILLSKLEGVEWSKPSRLNKKFNSPLHESYAAFSFNQRTIYFISNKSSDTTGFGGKDIYMCKLNKNGKWEKAVNLGPTINTPLDETCVFTHPDGKTIYFSSKGHNTMGGYDIFKSTLKNGEWSEPENLGYPINTVSDDVSFTLSANSKRGYYSSSKPGGMGDRDIYVITFLGPEKQGVINTEDNLLASIIKPVSDKVIEPKVKIRVSQPTILKGIIIDAITLEPLDASIEIVDNEKNETIGIFESNSSTGKYLVSLPSGRNYGIAVRSKGYLFHSENFIIPASSEYQVIYKNIELKKLDVGSKIVLKNIFFDTAKDSLRPESFAELARLTKLLNEFQNLRIEISGHTDNVGSATYNKNLSERRAKAVVNFLILEKINLARLEYTGYGFDQPIATNDTEEGRQKNRRTEFKILSTDFKPVKENKPEKENKEPEDPVLNE